MFGRRKRREAQDDLEAGYDDQPDYDDDPSDADAGEYGNVGVDEAFVTEHGGGPWDAGEPFPELARVDLGSLLVPVGPEFELQLVMAEQQGAWASVHHGASDLQLQAFAAPRNGSLWDEVRGEIAAEIASAGGSSQEQDGPLGRELLANVPDQPGSAQLVPVRFAGVDGPRWFLRAMFSGAAAVSPEAAAPLEMVLREVVVVRGEHPVPPRDLLELRLPADAQQQFAEQQAQAQQGPELPNPFERGPEITETR
jgi:Protein of unknown function (DUF3710)